jgi:hypothetical protein
MVNINNLIILLKKIKNNGRHAIAIESNVI